MQNQHKASKQSEALKTASQNIIEALCERELFGESLQGLILSNDLGIRTQGLELAASLLGETFYRTCIHELTKPEVIIGQDIPFCMWVIESICYSSLEAPIQRQLLSLIESLSFKDYHELCDLSLLSTLPQLKRLSLHNLPKAHCNDLSRFTTLSHFEFEMLNSPSCYGAQWLEQVRHMTHLEELGFKDSMNNPHWNFADHQSLTKLIIKAPHPYETLSLDLESCPNLREIQLNNCKQLLIKDCPQLTRLDVKFSSNNAEISIGHCPKLDCLSLENTMHAQSFNIEGFPKLRELNLSNGRLAYFHIEQLQQLKSLKLDKSYFDVEDLQVLSQIEDLDISLSHLFDIQFATFTHLKNLSINHSHVFDLDLSNCTALESLSLKNLQNLKTLHLSPYLKSVNLEKLQLETLDLVSLNDLQRVSLRKIKSLGSLRFTSPRLLGLIISDCPDLGHLELATQSLESINLNKLKYTPAQKRAQQSQSIEQSQLTFFDNSPLRSLKIRDCAIFDQITGLNHAHHLNELHIKYSKVKLSLDELSQLNQLNCIDLDLGYSTANTLSNCHYFSQMTKLRTLSLTAFETLQSLHGLEKLSALEHLELRRCTQLSDLSTIEDLTALKTIYINYCPKLSSLNLGPDHSQLSRCTIRNSLMNSLSVRGLTHLSLLDLDESIIQDLKVIDLQAVSHFVTPLLNRVVELSLIDINPSALSHTIKGLELDSAKLKSLTLTHLSSIKSLVCNTPNLNSLTLNDLDRLGKILVNSPALQELQVEGINNVTTLSIPHAENLKQGIDWHQFDQLNSLELGEYKFLRQLEQLSPLKDLQALTIKKIEAVDDLYQIHLLFPQLKALSLSAFVQYKSVLDLRKLTELETLFPCRLWRAVGLRKNFNPVSKKSPSSNSKVS